MGIGMIKGGGRGVGQSFALREEKKKKKTPKETETLMKREW